MKRNILYTLALLSIFVSCAKTEIPHFGGENDPNAVTINPSVAVLITRSNPLGDATAQTQFNEGDVITITDKSDNAVYKYALGSDGSWKPTDGKCLLWHSEPLDIEASYGLEGEDPYRGVPDQSDDGKIASADYMFFSGTGQRGNNNELAFTLNRQKTLVTVIIGSYGDQYSADTDKVSDLTINSIEPYVRDAGNAYTSDTSNGTIGYRYSAILPAIGSTIEVAYKVSGEDRKAITNQISLEAGKRVTITLRVGKDKLEPGDITVSGWADNGSWDDVQAKGPYPYLTFSAESGQMFSMSFNNGFSLVDENEYFEYSVGGGKWVAFTGPVSDVPFGGSLGNLRLRGKSSQGTAMECASTGRYKNATISFSTDGVAVKCTGDIRTLIDYENHAGVPTANARFYGLFEYCNVLTTAPDLPAMDLADHCYREMFYSCDGLAEAPELPATTLAHNCYESMFYACTALTEAPELPATDLATYCYYKMFCNCLELISAPTELPATTLEDHCYESMFQYCYELTEAPVLPATTLKDFCYRAMFGSCYKLTSVSMKATDVRADSCLLDWLSGAGTSASTRTLTLANQDAYNSIVNNLPDNWKDGQATINYLDN